MRVNGKQIEQLHKAMLSAFSDEFSLRYFVTTRLDQNLAEIAPKANLAEVVFELMLWANKHGKIKQLVENAIDQNPGNEDLREFAEAFLPASTPPPDVAGGRDPLKQQYTSNPFVWRGPITDPTAFFNRNREQKQLRDMLSKRQNCQIVAERRMGKTSLLLQTARAVGKWFPNAVVALMDLHNPACYTLDGFLRYVGKQLGWSHLPGTLVEFTENVETMSGRDLNRGS